MMVLPKEKNFFIGFENDEITFVGSNKPKDEAEVLADGQHICVTPGFIDSHSHVGTASAGEPSQEEESNEQMSSIYPLANALHSIYMDDPSFRKSVESGVLYSIGLLVAVT